MRFVVHPSIASRSKRRAARRRGTVLVAALVCLTVVLAVVGNMLLCTLQTGRQLRRERDLRQCELLLEAGTRHGLRQSSADDTYNGGTWELAADDIVGAGAGKVTIEVVRTSSPAVLRVVAEYPTGDPFSIRRSEEVSLVQNSSSSPE